MKEKIVSDKKARTVTIISFTVFIVSFACAIAAWMWIRKQPMDNGMADGIPVPLRKGLNKNEVIFSGIFNNKHLAKTYSKEDAAKKVRVNGDVGLGGDFDPAQWELYVEKNNGDTL